MNAFEYRNGHLYAEDCPLEALATTFGTPLYVYSRTHMREQFQILKKAMAPVNPVLHFAVKSNSNAAVINLFAQEGAGADIVSGNELWRAIQAGIDPAHAAFAGVGKTVEEIDYALSCDIGLFTVESEPELYRLSERAQATGQTARVAMRVNPDVDPKTHKYTSTGKKESKFGVDLQRAMAAYEQAAALPGLEIAGLHMHLGSPIMTLDPYVEALDKVAPFCAQLKALYPTFRILDIGGGLGIPYRPEEAEFDVQAFADAVIPRLQAIGLEVHLEPGRFLVGNGGVLLTQVQFIKDNPFRKFIVIDAAMNDLIRPALYQAYHEIMPVRETTETVFGDVVGPVCESGDFFASERDLPAVKPGELLAVKSAGAYAFAMASTYNSRPRPAEVMVDGNRVECIRTRETREDLIQGESIPQW